MAKYAHADGATQTGTNGKAPPLIAISEPLEHYRELQSTEKAQGSGSFVTSSVGGAPAASAAASARQQQQWWLDSWEESLGELLGGNARFVAIQGGAAPSLDGDGGLQLPDKLQGAEELTTHTHEEL